MQKLLKVIFPISVVIMAVFSGFTYFQSLSIAYSKYHTTNCLSNSLAYRISLSLALLVLGISLLVSIALDFITRRHKVNMTPKKLPIVSSAIALIVFGLAVAYLLIQPLQGSNINGQDTIFLIEGSVVGAAAIAFARFKAKPTLLFARAPIYLLPLLPAALFYYAKMFGLFYCF